MEAPARWLLILALVQILAAACVQREASQTGDPTPSATVTQTALQTATPPSTLTPITAASDAATSSRQTPERESESIYLNERFKGDSFESADQWRAILGEWEDRRPESPQPLDVLRGTLIGLQVAGRLIQDSSVANDKWSHCVAGSEIARATSFQVADHLAWAKEYQDLTDGDPATAFDYDDYTATLDGARQATTGQTCEECSVICEDRWGDRDAPWDGTGPPIQRD